MATLFSESHRSRHHAHMAPDSAMNSITSGSCCTLGMQHRRHSSGEILGAQSNAHTAIFCSESRIYAAVQKVFILSVAFQDLEPQNTAICARL